jgi:hypothetical protein
MMSRCLFASVALCAFAASARAQGVNVWKVGGVGGTADTARSALLTIHAKQPIDGWAGGFVPSLGVKCVDHAPSVFVVTGLRAKPERGKDRHFSVFYRLNDEKRVDEVWGQGESSDTLMSSDPSAFAQNLLKSKRLRLGFTPDSSSLMILEFPLAGLDKAMAKVPAACSSPA